MYRKIALLLSVCLSSIAAAQSADLSVTKDGPLAVTRGSDVTYTVTLTNFGPSAATSVVLTDVMVGDATFLSVTPSAGCTGTTCTIATLAAGATVVYDFTFSSDSDGTGTLENTATATSGTTDPNPQNDSDTASTLLITSADLAVTKSGQESAAADSDVTYTVTIANLGPDDADSVTLSDPIPPGMTFVSATQENGPPFNCTEATCTAATMPANTSATFTFVFHVDTGTPPGTTFTNTATATTTSFDPNEENNSAAVATTIPSPSADLSLGKGGPSFTGPDEDVVFTITLNNAGPDTATTVELNDTLPGDMTFVSINVSGTPLSCTTPAVGAGGTITCTSASYPAGGSTTITLTGHVPSQTPPGTEYTNTVIVTSVADPAEENDVATFTVVVLSSDVSVDKNGPATTDAATNIAYEILVTNEGPDTAAVTLIDQLPPGTTFVSMVRDSGPPANCSFDAGVVACTMTLGPSQVVDFTLTINAGTSPSITNVATVDVEGFDPDSSNDSDSVTTTITPRADLSVSKTGPASVTAGDDITYTVTVANNGPSAAANVSLTDVITPNATLVSAIQTSGPAFNCTGATCTIASLASGATASFDYTYIVQSNASGTVDDTATVSSTTSDPVGGNNSDSVSSTVTQLADVSIAKTGPAVAASGTDIVYQVTVQNLGLSDAANVIMTDTLPAGTTFVSLNQSGVPFNCVTGQTIICTVANLPTLSSTEFTITVHIDAAATGSIENDATAASTTPDANGTNNSTTFETGLNPGATDLSIVKTANGASFPAGSTVTYTLNVTNNGPAVAFATTVTDELPAGTTLESATATQGSCTGTTTVVCT
ncbi:MAG TPA: CARDB domain-containing protein, partial [Thermoanaerobaculia bacterium]|nr:CARDB domain-containing protein [Thermoanaerobaculia bacterium]